MRVRWNIKRSGIGVPSYRRLSESRKTRKKTKGRKGRRCLLFNNGSLVEYVVFCATKKSGIGVPSYRRLSESRKTQKGRKGRKRRMGLWFIKVLYTSLRVCMYTPESRTARQINGMNAIKAFPGACLLP